MQRHKVRKTGKSQGAVVITGASTGIGRACALELDRRGFQVFAGIRKEADADSLRRAATSHLTPVFLDVTEKSAITSAVEQVRQAVGSAGVMGLVNNAGIAVPGPLEYQPESDIRRQLETNVIGPVMVTKAFLPLIRQARGRVVAISSIAGKLPMPFNGAHCGTKHALEGIFSTLRIELRPWGIHVAIVEPGTIATGMVEKFTRGARASLITLPPEGRERYGPAMQIMIDKLLAHIHQGSPPGVVADAVTHALTAARPRARYPVGGNARMMLGLARVLPDRLMEHIISHFFGLPSSRAVK